MLSLQEIIDMGLHRHFYEDPTIIGTRAHGNCQICDKNDRIKYGHVEQINRLDVVLGCARCKCRWLWNAK